jgi:hypothetical protein
MHSKWHYHLYNLRPRPIYLPTTPKHERVLWQAHENMQCNLEEEATPLHSFPKHKSRLRSWGKVYFITNTLKVLPRLANFAFFITEHRHLPKLIITNPNACPVHTTLPHTTYTVHSAPCSHSNCQLLKRRLKLIKFWALFSFLSLLSLDFLRLDIHVA